MSAGDRVGGLRPCGGVLRRDAGIPAGRRRARRGARGVGRRAGCRPRACSRSGSARAASRSRWRLTFARSRASISRRQMLAQLAAKRGARRVDPVRADATRLPFADGCFDAVLAVHVFHLIPRWRDVLAEVARVLRPDGSLLHAADDQSAGGSLGVSAAPDRRRAGDGERRRAARAARDIPRGGGLAPRGARPSGSASRARSRRGS